MNVHEQAQQMTDEKWLKVAKKREKFDHIHSQLLEMASVAGYPNDINGYINSLKSVDDNAPKRNLETLPPFNHWDQVAKSLFPKR